MNSFDNLVITGFIRGTHGVDGTLVVESCSGEWKHFLPLKTLWLQKNHTTEDSPCVEYQVERVEENHPWIKLSTIDDLTVAGTLKGYSILVPRDHAHKLSFNEWFVDDLVGCAVTYCEEFLGRVTAVVDGGNGQLLEVTDEKVLTKDARAPHTHYIPFSMQFLKSIDTINKAIELKVRWIFT